VGIKNKYLIVSNFRCGSAWLQSVLANLDGIFCDYEFRLSSPRWPISPQHIIIEKGGKDVSELLDRNFDEEGIVGSRLLLEPRKYSEEEYQTLLDALDNDVKIIHVRRYYRDIISSIILNRAYLLSPSSEKDSSAVLTEIEKLLERGDYSELKLSPTKCCSTIVSLSANDRFMQSLELGREYLSINYDEIEQEFSNIVQFLGGNIPSQKKFFAMVDSPIRKLPAEPFPKVLSHSRVVDVLQKFEQYQVLYYHLQFLSDMGRSAVLKTREHENIQFEQPPFDVKKFKDICLICLDQIPKIEDLKELLSRKKTGLPPHSVFIVFSSYYRIKSILEDKFFSFFLRNGCLKLWYTEELEEMVAKESLNHRSPFNFTSSFLFLQEDHLYKKSIKLIWSYRKMVLRDVEICKESIATYYAGKIFRKRLLKLTENSSVKVYVERSCTSIAVKRFSDGVANAFKKIGCEVFMHPPCSGGEGDFTSATQREIEHFKPDLLVKSPNVYVDPPKLILKKGPPTLLPIFDLAPHIEYLEHLEKTSRDPHLITFFIHHYMRRPYLQGGLKEEQLMNECPPCEEPPFDPAKITIDPKYDVGFVKTLGNYFNLSEVLQPETEEEQKDVQQLDRKVFQYIHGEASIKLFDFFALANKKVWERPLVNYHHQQFCMYYIDVLYREGFSLGLTGSNWEKVPGYAASALGHAEKREDYFMRFLENKINISMNPWVRHHARIFEGGIVGAFFLVYKVPEEINWTEMPVELKAGEHFDYFSSSEELVEKCHYYLDRPKLRNDIKENLRATVRKNFSYENFCQRALDKFFYLTTTPI